MFATRPDLSPPLADGSPSLSAVPVEILFSRGWPRFPGTEDLVSTRLRSSWPARARRYAVRELGPYSLAQLRAQTLAIQLTKKQLDRGLGWFDVEQDDCTRGENPGSARFTMRPRKGCYPILRHASVSNLIARMPTRSLFGAIGFRVRV